MRSGSLLLGMTNDGTEPLRASSEEEVVVPEHTAAFLVRGRAAEVIEVVEPPEDAKID
jgi:hypothetical protein